MPRRKLLLLSLAATALLAAIAAFLYERYLGFERAGLEARFPEDAYAYLSVRHLRQAGFAFATSEQLQSLSRIATAIAKTLSDAAGKDAERLGETQDIDPALLQKLARHFKTQLSIAALPASRAQSTIPDFVLATHFYGSPSELHATLLAIALSASSESETYRWTSDERSGIPIHSLQIETKPDREPNPLASDLQPTWAVSAGILYLASHSSALRSILAFNASPSPGPSLADIPAIRQLPDYLAAPDLTVFVNAPQALTMLERQLQPKLAQSGGLWSSVSLERLFDELGLTQFESLTAAARLGGDFPAYWGLRYGERTGLLQAIAPAAQPYHDREADFSLAGTEALAIDGGHALLIAKDALLRASPALNLPYFALRSAVYASARLSLETSLRESFENQAVSLYTLDTGTGRDAYGRVIQQVAPDFAVKLKLTPEQTVTEIIRRQIPTALNALPDRAYQEPFPGGGALHIDGDRDATITSGRFALAFDEAYLTLGYGTLKSFETLSRRSETYPPLPDLEDYAPTTQIGSGSWIAQRLPSTLYQIATLFYLQQNPGKPIPMEYRSFDWTALTALEQAREAKTYDDGESHLYRISRQTQ